MDQRTKMVVALSLQNCTDVFDHENINIRLYEQKDAVTRTTVDHDEWYKGFLRTLAHRGYVGTAEELTDYLDELEASGTFSYKGGVVTMMPGRMWDIYQPLLHELNRARKQ